MFEEFRDKILDYLRAERDFIEADIAAHDALGDVEKEDLGLLIRDAKLVSHEGQHVVYRAEVNMTKLRAGDGVSLIDLDSGKRINAIVDENGIDTIALTLPILATPPRLVRIEVIEVQLNDSLISLISDIRPGGPGVAFLKMLSGELHPKMSGFGSIEDVHESEIPNSFNKEQADSVRAIAKRPNLYYLQGIPGAGKTHVLSIIAQVYARRGKDVLVMALTHQAVNNALNKICAVAPELSVAKIGSEFKNIGLSDEVVRFSSFRDYVAERGRSGRFVEKVGRVLGMTFQSAIFNLGRIASPFMPQVLLFDEAGQLPLTHAAAIGAFKCGSIVFVGDDLQMPPIYHEQLKKNELSHSVFEHIKSLYQECGIVLNTTYRMSRLIAAYVAKRFYLPKGIDLRCAENSIGNRGESAIEYVACKAPGSTDENGVEAEKAIEVVAGALECGISPKRMAVITPFRRQVRLVRKLMLERLPELEVYPLVDTVERLQGQDVELIILSFAVDDVKYFLDHQSFILNPNRLNVMFSRATNRVVVIASQIVLDLLRDNDL